MGTGQCHGNLCNHEKEAFGVNVSQAKHIASIPGLSNAVPKEGECILQNLEDISHEERAFAFEQEQKWARYEDPIMDPAKWAKYEDDILDPAKFRRWENKWLVNDIDPFAPTTGPTISEYSI
eukprot:gnl/TRDRNA2_/TRDRNA2_85077_c0_seq2.p2 gnl/TRDRNA2_/TRDRNA2_85077_c0~~gnl/TRDRNA2_/TRDRNA2_85077_c0_seq2.p2  ORF type:complete len:122 (-),score=19.74 gnl/TRDRNA2_/TRDRNA2_85077_c0_seq2:79-444(-)